MEDISALIRATEINFIEQYVIEKRKQEKITPKFNPGWESSCFASGEWYNFINRQLLTVVEGYGSWKELNDSSTRASVIDEIHQDKIFLAIIVCGQIYLLRERTSLEVE